MALKREYLSVAGQFHAEKEPTDGREVYTRDALGSLAAISDKDGNFVSRTEYKACGDLVTFSGQAFLSSLPSPFLWNGSNGYRGNLLYRMYTSHYGKARYYSGLH